MGTYIDFETNSEVTDVLFQIISGTVSVKEIVKALSQPQSTVSSKLQFLRDVGVVDKVKWEYRPNYNKLVGICGKIFRDILKNEIEFREFNKKYVNPQKKKEIEDSIEGLKNIIKKSSNYISRPLFKKILQTASWFYPKLNCKVSLYEVIENFYLGMIGTTEKIDDNRLSEMKNLIGRVYSKNELFFLSSVK